MLAPVVRGRKGDYETLLADLRQQGFARARVDGEVRRARPTKRRARRATRSTPSRSSSTGSCSATGIERRLTDSLETALRLAEGVAEVAARARARATRPTRAETLTFSQHLACPNDGTSLRRAGAPQLLVQLALRRVRALRRARHPLRGRPRAGRAQPRPVARRGRDRAVGRRAHASTSTALLEAVAEELRHPRSTTPWTKLKKASRRCCSTARAPSKVHVAVQEPLRPHPLATTRHVRGRDPVPPAPPLRGRVRLVARADRGLHARGAVPGVRRRPAQARVARRHRRRPQHLRASCACRSARRPTSLAGLELSERDRMIAERVLKEINARMRLPARRRPRLPRRSTASAGTLAGGEAQRIRLASQIGSRPGRRALRARRAVDRPAPARQPAADRHARSACATSATRCSSSSTTRTRSRSPTTSSTSGPGAGEHGGEIVLLRHGARACCKNQESITGQYLSGKRTIPVPEMRREPGDEWLVDHGAPASTTCKNIDVEFPLGCFVAVTGVSGSGKSTLVNDILLPVADAEDLQVEDRRPGRHKTVEGIELLDKVINIDQSPIGRTPRSNPATYTGVFDHIRKLFAQTQEAKVRGYLPGRFSLQRQGRPLRGVRRRRHDQDRDALPARRVRAVRGVQGRPLQPRHARHHVQGQEHRRGARPAVRGGARVLRQPADRSPATCRRSSTSASATCGSASRRRRCRAARPSGSSWRRELAKRSTGHTIYILDEPTTGLHFEDIRKLLTVLQPAGRPGQHRARHRAQPRRHQDRRLDHRPRPRGRLRRRHGRRRGHARARGQDRESYTGQFLRPLLDGVWPR